jgi:hypothetical protein
MGDWSSLHSKTMGKGRRGEGRERKGRIRKS